MPVAEFVQRGGAETAADIDAAEGGVQRFQQLGAQPAPGGDSEVRVVQNIRDTVDRGDFAEQEIPQEKRVRPADPAEGF